MKKLTNLLAALVFVSLSIFMSCGKDDGPGVVDPLVGQAELLQRSWTVNHSDVRYDQGVPDVSWEGFSLTITNASTEGGSYQTSGVPDGFASVWPATGTWTFNNTTGSEMLRDGTVVMSVINLSESTATLAFNIASTGGRTAGIAGAWQFTFISN